MAWYNTGTIALTNGSATVTGSGTNFLVGAQIGEALYAPDGKLYEIQTINSATVITLASNYLGSTASTQGYQIIPTQSLVADLASDVTDLISDFADVRDYAGNGKFNDGAVGTPGITFTQDQDNGLYRIGSNNWALAAGGQQVVNLTTTAMNFPDNNKAIFGAGSDLEIYHNGSHSFISDVGTGRLYLQGTDGVRVTNASAVNMISAVSGDGVYSYYNGGLKLATTATGIDVTGTADGLVVNDGGVGTATDLIKIKSGWSSPSGLKAISFEDQSGNTIGQLGVSYSGGVGAFEIDSLYNSGNNSNKVFKASAGGDISFYEDTGTTPKFFWDASAESLSIGASTAVTDRRFQVTGLNPSLTSTVSQFGIVNNATFANTVTSNIFNLYTGPNVSSGATLSNLYNLYLEGNNFTGSTVTNSFGIYQSGVNDKNYFAGSVGIGTTSPNSAGLGANGQTLQLGARTFIATDSSGDTRLGGLSGSNITAFYQGGTEAMRIDSSGSLLVGCPSLPSSSVKGAAFLGNANQGRLYVSADSTAARDLAYFINPNGIIGTITTTSSSTAYNTSSDYRLKENVVGMSGATERLKQLKPSRFNFIADADTTVDGFLAHEVQDIVPEAITGTKDAVDADGNPKYQGIDQSKLVPLLVATIQELEARIAALES
jgi:hypothetical protein